MDNMSDETKANELETTEDGIGNPLGVVTDLLSDAVIPAPIRRNAFKAFGQLCTAAIEVPVAYLEGKATEMRAGTEARIKITKENADQIAQQMNVPPEYARRAANKFAQKIIREQVNLDEISAVAANELNEGEPTNSKDQGADKNFEQTVNDDWLNNFENEASQKSTEEMRLLFGRILAGEIRKPGTYSIKAVKILGELNQSAADLFKKLCSVCIVFEIPSDEHILDIRVPSLGGNAGSNVLSPYGLSFDRLNVLHEYGLIIQNYDSQCDYRLGIANENPQGVIPFRHQERQWVLLPTSGWESREEFRVSGVAFSRAGRELFRVVDLVPMEKYTEDLQRFLAGQKLQMVEVSSQNKI